MAGELGLEPRMTVPKTVVLPLHHSPAGPAYTRPEAGRRSNTPEPRGMQHPLSRLFSKTVKRGLRAGKAVAISPLLKSECGSAW